MDKEGVRNKREDTEQNEQEKKKHAERGEDREERGGELYFSHSPPMHDLFFVLSNPTDDRGGWLNHAKIRVNTQSLTPPTPGNSPYTK